MTLALVLFSTSCIAMITMLYMKLHEIKIGRYLLFPTLRQRSDLYLKKVWRNVERFFRIIGSGKFWIALTVFLAREFHENVLKHPKVTSTSKKVVNVVKGRKTIKSKGPVSFYLQDVSEYKNGLRTE
jgi:hypothetical protein